VGDCDALIARIVERARATVPGEGMGAIITRSQVEFLRDAIGRAEKDGAKVLLDGRTFKAKGEYAEGNWIGPTVLDHVKPGSEAATHELFGPILSIVRCKDLSQALQIERSIDYGNATSVFTQNGALAEEVVRQATSGMVGVNIGVPVPREPFSFGGLYESKFGSGDITGINSLNFWSNHKKVTVKWAPQKDANWMS
jgi:malonate-semialdehyde dehydrogenase (acetylating)/methylmalonate-semialdehyde dehydrogenase